MAIPLLCAVAWGGDRDGDGLSDFEETHKYGTDPDLKDSDNDGKPDGDWNERREFAYTVRSLVRVMRPAQAQSGVQQDARIVAETPEYVVLEVVHYPLNTAASALKGNRQWRKDATRPKEFLASTTTSSFTPKVRDTLLAELRAGGLDVEKCDDRELVEAAAKRLLDRAKYHRGFTTFFVEFADGKAAVKPGLEAAVARNRLEGVSLADQWRRELFAADMFATKSHSSCTSTSIYFAGCMRALGIPARIVYCIPVIDASDPTEFRMLDRIRHPVVRETIQSALTRSRGSWSSHCYNEVYVGGRWWGLNYKTLGQPNLDRNYFGLMTHVLTVRDWSDAKIADTVGWRQGVRVRADVFGHANPYSTIELSDEFGVHSGMTVPKPIPALARLTIEKAIWYRDRPKGVSMRMNAKDKSGHVLLKVTENRDGSLQQYAKFWAGVDRSFVLSAQGNPDIVAKAERGYWGSGWFYLRIDPKQVQRMKRGVPYTLVPRNGRDGFDWHAGRVTLSR